MDGTAGEHRRCGLASPSRDDARGADRLARRGILGLQRHCPRPVPEPRPAAGATSAFACCRRSCWRRLPLACVWARRHRLRACRRRDHGFGLRVEWLALCGSRPPAPSRAALLRPAGVAYVGLAGGRAVWLRADPARRAAPMCCSCCWWSGPSDIGAYLVGRLDRRSAAGAAHLPGQDLVGRARRPARRDCGRAARGPSACRVGAVPGAAALVAALLGVVAQAGDLLESCVKRRFGGEGFRPSHPRPWRPVRSAGRRVGRGAGGGPAGALPSVVE